MDIETVKAFIASLLRHFLTGFGSYLVGEGIITQAQWDTMLVGTVSIGVGLIWSYWQKRSMKNVTPKAVTDA